MAEENHEIEKQMREAQSKLIAAESALEGARKQRLRIAIWSAVGGFLVFAIVGQWFPGYQLDSTAAAGSRDSAEEAVGKVMAELCAERFMKPSGLEARLATLRNATGDWSKANFIREGEWAETPDGEKSSHDTAAKCAAMIAEQASGEAEKAS